MNFESDYVKYALQATFTLLAVSSTYLVNLSRPETLLAFTTVPLLFGYTAYISSEKFQKSSFISLAALAFAPLGLLYAAVAVVVSLGNVLVSFFSRGETFRDFYSTVSLPLLFSGVLVGLVLFLSITSSPQQMDAVSSTVSNSIAGGTEKVMQQTGLNPGDRQEKLIQSISAVTISKTHAYVIENTSRQLSPEDLANVSSAFREASNEVPDRVIQQASTRSTDISGTVEKAVDTMFTGSFLLLLIPLAAVAIYGVHPVIGLLTALSGLLFRKMDGYVSETG
ncbi:hypothetical protein ACK3SF_02145 [Candidatus Nanosalina sp. VS9-1]|uniref:hypothetical protein n=1 Tax=Candidatus Nanosalina sp. VS9-1 TaxID=3388566 RepID=UPI0039E0389C